MKKFIKICSFKSIVSNKLDLIDRKLLYQLDINSRQTFKELAKKLRIAKETARFRVNRLVENGYIKNFLTTINISQLNRFYYKLFYKFHKTNHQIDQEIISFIQDYKSIAYFASTEGRYDLTFLLLSKDMRSLYNFLIPFFVTQTSLQSMDFSNEFSDLSVGDAWSPKYEKLGAGFSVITSRSEKMESIVKEMIDDGCLSAEEIDKNKASEMHGHMLDFKKRGGFIRNKWRRYLGFRSPDYGIIINDMPISRYIVEIVISGVFVVCRNSISRKILEFIPESIIGPFFNKSRLLWKNLSKPTKRKGLSGLNISEVDNGRVF